jgi:SAM-dependent methyltransferase
MNSEPDDGVMAEQSEENRAFSRRLAAESIAAGDPTGWFERLYAAAEHGQAVVPWADLTPNPSMVAALADISGLPDQPVLAALPGMPPAGRERALVVGCGLGDDAEYVASLGFDTTAFDVSPTAIARAVKRFPASTVDYQTADLLAPPQEWHHAFHLVVEVYTIQVLTGDARRHAVQQICRLVAPGGRLLVIARARGDRDDPGKMPWPLTRDEIRAFRRNGLTEVSIVDFPDPEEPAVRRWRAWFMAPPSAD